MAEGMALARLRPESLADVGGDEDAPRWQQRKSRATRNAMLDAALHCLAECGYAGCSLQTVASRAGVSRGAMLHHYASKLDLMAAVIEYAFYRRMANFLDRIRELSEEERKVRNAGIAVSFAISQTPEYRAYLELHVASRTDPDLRAIFLERAGLYERVWRTEIENVFPEWAGDGRLDMLNDFVWVMIDGLALNIDIWADPARVDAILSLIAKTIIGIRAGTLDI
jgi:AcrR family transcriptional regulator